MDTLNDRFGELEVLLPKFKDHAASEIIAAAKAISRTFKNGNKILICGNGGSAADSQHFAAEFVNAFGRDLVRKALPALALSTDTSILTSISNDFSFENVFARQVQAYGGLGDLLIVLTTSGSSTNCLKAVEEAKFCKMSTISFTKVDGEVAKMTDIAIEVPSNSTQHIQECHMVAYHVITELVEEELFRGTEF